MVFKLAASEHAWKQKIPLIIKWSLMISLIVYCFYKEPVSSHFWRTNIVSNIFVLETVFSFRISAKDHIKILADAGIKMALVLKGN